MKTTCDFLMEDVARKYGFEANETVKFCKLIEKGGSALEVQKEYEKLMEKPIDV